MSAQWSNSRRLSERIVVTGKLTLETPTHFGNGEGNGLLDMPLHVDALSGNALLTGTSLAGALRDYLRRYTAQDKLAEQIFGQVVLPRDEEGTAQSEESRVIIDDAIGTHPNVELRDGVAIDPKTRIAEDDKKFDIELLAAGTEFDLSFELLLRKDDDRIQLLQGFALALQGLAQGEIRLGKRKRRGFGRCSVKQWAVQRFDMTTPQGIIAWLRSEPPTDHVNQSFSSDLFTLLDVPALTLPAPTFTLDATFTLDGSLLIRSVPGEGDGADFVHLRSNRKVGDHKRSESIVSGTSVAGALRARALRIVNTLTSSENNHEFVDNLFGYRVKHRQDDTPLWASRLWVEETVIQEPIRLVQSRVKIDRFTGGSYPGALFSEEAVFGATQTRIRIQLKLGEPTNDKSNTQAEIGLLLLLLKDLWTGDLPIGGESSVGRGRLRGEHATIGVDNHTWVLKVGDGQRLDCSPEALTALESYVQHFVEAVR